MAPNLLLKAGFVRGDYDSNEAVSKCRTDFILQNCYSFLIGNGYNFKPMSAVNSKEERVLKVFIAIIKEFRDSYATSIQEMTRKMTYVSVDLLPQLLQRVSAELFCEGITWSKMIGFFVFIGELAVQHERNVQNDSSGDVINKLYESFCRHVKENLMSWVEEHGGWEGVDCLTIKKDSTPKIDTTTSSVLNATTSSVLNATTSSVLNATKSSVLNTTRSSEQGWYKNLAAGAFRVVGTLFQLAAPHAQSYA